MQRLASQVLSRPPVFLPVPALYVGAFFFGAGVMVLYALLVTVSLAPALSFVAGALYLASHLAAVAVYIMVWSALASLWPAKGTRYPMPHWWGFLLAVSVASFMQPAVQIALREVWRHRFGVEMVPVSADRIVQSTFRAAMFSAVHWFICRRIALGRA